LLAGSCCLSIARALAKISSHPRMPRMPRYFSGSWDHWARTSLAHRSWLSGSSGGGTRSVNGFTCDRFGRTRRWLDNGPRLTCLCF
jgi:hypothetical protein